jgi:hypothetical protein
MPLRNILKGEIFHHCKAVVFIYPARDHKSADHNPVNSVGWSGLLVLILWAVPTKVAVPNCRFYLAGIATILTSAHELFTHTQASTTSGVPRHDCEIESCYLPKFRIVDDDDDVRETICEVEFLGSRLPYQTIYRRYTLETDPTEIKVQIITGVVVAMYRSSLSGNV